MKKDLEAIFSVFPGLVYYPRTLSVIDKRCQIETIKGWGVEKDADTRAMINRRIEELENRDVDPNWEPKKDITIINRIRWETQKDGQLLPIIKIFPIRLTCGRFASFRASSNVEIESLFLARGDEIVVKDDNGKPKIERVWSRGGYGQHYPRWCSSCGGRVCRSLGGEFFCRNYSACERMLDTFVDCDDYKIVTSTFLSCQES